MLRFVIYFLFIIGISAGCVWLLENEGAVVINWLNYRIEANLAFSAISLAIILITLVVLVEVILWIFSTPEKISKDLKYKREIRGLLTLTEGYVALIAGDTKKAGNLALASQRLLPGQPYSQLLSAETAKLEQKYTEADKYFAEIAADNKTKSIALKGLVESSEQQGNIDQAISLTKEARKNRETSKWADKTLANLYVAKCEWYKAKVQMEKLLPGQLSYFFANSAEKRQYIKIKHEYVIVCIMYAKTLVAENKLNDAYKTSLKAYDLQPGFLSAAKALIEIALAFGKHSKARSVIEKVWAIEPGFELASQYLKLYQDENIKTRLGKIRKLYDINPDNIESAKALIAFAINHDMVELAKEQLELALDKHDSSVLELVLTKLESGGEADLQEAKLITRSEKYLRNKYSWVCEKCGWAAKDWNGVCKNCNSFNSIRRQNAGSTLNGTQKIEAPDLRKASTL